MLTAQRILPRRKRKRNSDWRAPITGFLRFSMRWIFTLFHARDSMTHTTLSVNGAGELQKLAQRKITTF